MKGLLHTDYLFAIFFNYGDYFLNLRTIAYILNCFVTNFLLKHYEESLMWLLSWEVPSVESNMKWKMLSLK